MQPQRDDAAVARRAEIAAQVTAQISQEFSGPLPPPTVLAGYEQHVPGSAIRILEMAELEQRHRHDLEDRQLGDETSLAQRGQFFGFVVALVGLAVTAYLGASGQPAAAAIIGAVDLIGLVSIFLLRVRHESRELPTVHVENRPGGVPDSRRIPATSPPLSRTQKRARQRRR